LDALLAKGDDVTIPEIADYEVRRELLRADKLRGIERLDALALRLGIVPLTRAVMLKAAEFWAEARKRGRPTANALALDGDMILAAQAVLLAEDGAEVLIATTNIDHLARFAPTARWQDIA
jgi:predicted nucleic acid-binding protein